MRLIKSFTFLILAVLYFALLSCIKQGKNSSQPTQICTEESQINIYNPNDSILIFFGGKYKGRSFGKLKIEHIRNNVILHDAGFRLTKENYVKVSGNIKLKPEDTLKIIFSNNEVITITQFDNEPYFGGKKFLGCFLGSCRVNGKVTAAKNGINIYQ